MIRGLMWFWLAWSLVFGLVATAMFAITRSPWQLSAGLVHLGFCAYYARELWGDR